MAAHQLHPNRCIAYVYEIIVDDVVRYIGKGTGRRASEHLRIADRLNRQLKVGQKVKRSYFYKKLSEALLNGGRCEWRVIRHGLTDQAAYDLEVELIASAPEWQLWNESPGGNGHTSEFLKTIWSDPARRKNHSDRALKAWAAHPEWRGARFADPGSRARQSDMVREKWRDPEYREMQRRARSLGKRAKRVKFSEKASRKAKERWSDPSFKSRMAASMRAAYESDERRAAIRERMKKMWADPEFRARWKRNRMAPKERLR